MCWQLTTKAEQNVLAAATVARGLQGTGDLEQDGGRNSGKVIKDNYPTFSFKHILPL